MSNPFKRTKGVRRRRPADPLACVFNGRESDRHLLVPPFHRQHRLQIRLTKFVSGPKEIITHVYATARPSGNGEAYVEGAYWYEKELPAHEPVFAEPKLVLICAAPFSVPVIVFPSEKLSEPVSPSVEDEIRTCEREGDFGAGFVEQARSVYKKNDHRAAIKRRIIEVLGSAILEEKSYRGVNVPG